MNTTIRKQEVILLTDDGTCGSSPIHTEMSCDEFTTNLSVNGGIRDWSQYGASSKVWLVLQMIQAVIVSSVQR